MSSLIHITNLSKVYGTKKNPIPALGPVDLGILKGAFCVILGRSGSGKSTLLNLMAGLDQATTGELTVGKNKLTSIKGKKLAKYRSKIGIIFQFYNLLPNLNTIENVMMGAWAGGNQTDAHKAQKLLERFGLGHRINANVKTLSGGEKQRVAICRALISDPQILFCDEPTGALDTQSENSVKEILLDLNKSQGLTIVMVTHNPDFASLASQIVRMQDGLIIENQLKSASQI